MASVFSLSSLKADEAQRDLRKEKKKLPSVPLKVSARSALVPCGAEGLTP